jgi:hypothetical protein
MFNSMSFEKYLNNISNFKLSVVSNVIEFEMAFKSNLNFNTYISKIIIKTSKQLRFVGRYCNNITNTAITISNNLCYS